jgi:hypothetical protein
MIYTYITCMLYNKTWRDGTGATRLKGVHTYVSQDSSRNLNCLRKNDLKRAKNKLVIFPLKLNHFDEKKMLKYTNFKEPIMQGDGLNELTWLPIN